MLITLRGKAIDILAASLQSLGFVGGVLSCQIFLENFGAELETLSLCICNCFSLHPEFVVLSGTAIHYVAGRN